MGFVLDKIVGKIVDQEVTINFDYTSPVVDVSYAEGPIAFQFIYDNGSSVDMTLSVEGSIDGVNFAELTDSDQQIVDDSGTVIWDIDGVGIVYMRIKVTVSTGSIDLDKIHYIGGRRH